MNALLSVVSATGSLIGLVTAAWTLASARRNHRQVDIGKLLAFLSLPMTLVRCLSRNREVTRWLLRQAIRFLPADQRDRYYLEWLANIEQLEQEGLPTVGEGIQILHAGAQIGSRRRAQLASARTKQRARRLGPGWVGALTTIGSFLITLSALLVADAPLGRVQLGLAAAGSLILGMVAGDQARITQPDDR